MKKTKKSRAGLLLVPAGVLALFLAAYGVMRTFQFSINGSAETEIALGEPYREKGAKASFVWMDISDKVQTEGLVDDTKPGTYTVTYRVGGRELSRTVEVRDISVPKISLKGEEKIIVEFGGAYTEPGCTAVDNVDGDLTAQVEISGEVDTSKSGVYTITYQVTDSSGNTGKAQRTVEVAARSPLTMGLAEFTLEEAFPDVILQETEDAGEEYLLGTILIGDSITFNTAYFGFIPRENVWARENMNPESIQTEPVYVQEEKQEERLVYDVIAEKKPKRVIINLGANCGWMDQEVFLRYYESFAQRLQELSPETDIMISSLYPVDARYDKPERIGGISNDKCNKINYELAMICRRNGLSFLNVASVLKDQNGQAASGSVYESDGIHPNKETYPKIIDYIRRHPKLEGTEGSGGQES